MNNAPKQFLRLYLPTFVADAVDKITNTQVGSSVVQSLLSRFGGNGGKKYASFLRIGKSASQLDVFENLMAQYDDGDMRFVALTMFMEKCGAGESASGFEGQLEELLLVKKQYPERLNIFLGVDPRWKSNGKELQQTIARYFDTQLQISETKSVYPFCGLKLYPSTGFFVYDKRLMETYEWAAENGVPVLSHCNYLGGIYNNVTSDIAAIMQTQNGFSSQTFNQGIIKKKSGVANWLLGRGQANNNKYNCSYFLDPQTYIPVFEYFKNKPKPLKICLAHFGGNIQMRVSNNIETGSSYQAPPFGSTPVNWFNQIKDILKDYPAAYTDISYALFDQKIHEVILNRDLLDADAGSRILFGTDYFMTEQEQPEKQTYQVFKKAAQALTLPGSDALNTVSAWDKIAAMNPATFLSSKYFS
jgi:predicted TIM-barrel fold metal-dependent hydrolase